MFLLPSQWVFSTVEVANPVLFVGVFVRLLPLFCFCCFVWFAFFSRKRKSGWGFAGRRRLCWVIVLFWLIGFAAKLMTTVLCTELYLKGDSLSVRTEPLSDIGQTGEKKTSCES